MLIIGFGFFSLQILLSGIKFKIVLCFYQWVNTNSDEFLCGHCLRIVSTELCIDHYCDSGYWIYLHATPLYRRQARQYCKTPYEDLFFEYEWLGEMD